MALGTVEITIEEYCKLSELNGRVMAFADYVRAENCSIGKKECAAILGFNLEVENAGTDRE